jgi:hypothetical protein
MVDFNYEIRYVETILPELEKYLRSQELYRMVFVPREGKEPPYPTLTLGTYLLALKRAQGFIKTANQQSHWQKLARETDRLRSQWRQAWIDKARLDSSSRLKRWGDFLREYLQKPADQLDRYAYEVRNRVILELLKEENPEHLETWNTLEQLDQRFRERWIKGDFIWETELETTFPSDPFWFLWGKPC